jgi:hypothetical protein
MSNLPDEDEEFLYGDAEMEASDSNRQIGAKNEEDELYDLYGDDETKE